MKGCKSIFTSCSGFSLVEVIATIIIMGILAAFFVHFMGTAIDYSWESVEFVAGEAEAEGKLEEIIAYFTSKINQDPDSALPLTISEFSSDASMNYIEFDVGGTPTVIAGPGTTLQVTVQAPGNDLTTILTKSRASSSDPMVNY
jgi:prepilin-type N-terminal cleavage/methylation domain-containing protein